MLVGLLQYMLHRMRAKTLSRRRSGAEKETSVHILCECTVLEKIRMQTLGFARMNQKQKKEAGLSGPVAISKKVGLLHSLL